MSNVNAANYGNYGGTYSVPADILLQAAPKMRLNLDGTGTIEVRGSINVSGVVDNSTGTYTANLTASMADSNFTVATNGHRAEDQALGVRQSGIAVGSLIITAKGHTAATAQDCDSVNVTLLGDLA